MKFIPELEGLRGLAVALVVILHTTPWLPNAGLVGVELFFALSGYLTARIALEQELSWTDFMARRLRRIWPLLLVVCLVCFAAFSTFERPYWEAVGAAVFLEGPRFATGAITYISHTWTLTVEILCYAIIGLLALGRDRLQFAIGALVCAVFSVVLWSMLDTSGMHKAAYGLPISRASTIFLGAILACLPPLKRSVAQWAAPAALMILGFIAIGTTAIPVAVVGLLAMVAVAGLVAAPMALMRAPGLTALGRISFGVYLWHFPIAMILVDAPAVASFTITSLVSILLARLTYQTIEMPFRSPRSDRAGLRRSAEFNVG
ncbi:acyltransferase family protein [Litorisediminicola beolgyonensis]|uniref:Acyltransferase family protein n=1 Tax=Litorisediminicola beolgyonensis TaxID=1173614 RepID=A0ABW3ZEP7_9RHOB